MQFCTCVDSSLVGDADAVTCRLLLLLMMMMMLVMMCADDERQFGFVRILMGDEMSKRAKFVLFTWIGANVSALKRAKVSTDKTAVKAVILVRYNSSTPHPIYIAAACSLVVFDQRPMAAIELQRVRTSS